MEITNRNISYTLDLINRRVISGSVGMKGYPANNICV